MASFDDFKKRVRALAGQQRRSVDIKRGEHRRLMAESDAYRQRFDAAAQALFSRVIDGRLAFVADEMDAVRYEPSPDVHHGVLRFNDDGRYAATVRLHLSVEPAGEDGLALVSRPEIVPLLVPIEPGRLVMSLDRADEDASARFVEEQVTRFLRTYEGLGEISGYRTPSVVKDPGCGMEINRADAVAKERYLGRSYYFCVSECHRRFTEDPERFSRSIGSVG